MSWQHLSISGISQLLLARFRPNFKGWLMGPSWTDSNCHGDICQGNICPGNICPYREYLSCYWPDFYQTLKVDSLDHLEQKKLSKKLLIFDPKQILGNKKTFLVWKNLWSETNFKSKKNVLSEIYFWRKKFLVRKKLLVWKNLVLKIFGPKKKFVRKKILVQKRFWSTKHFCSKIFLYDRIFLGWNI